MTANKEFQVEDRVIAKCNVGRVGPGRIGTVINVDFSVDVCFDDNIGGHDCGMPREYVPGYGWRVPAEYLELVDDSPNLNTDELDGFFAEMFGAQSRS